MSVISFDPPYPQPKDNNRGWWAASLIMVSGLLLGLLLAGCGNLDSSSVGTDLTPLADAVKYTPNETCSTPPGVAKTLTTPSGNAAITIYRVRP